MPKLTVSLKQTLGRGLLGKVCLFEGGGGIEPPEEADYSKRTIFGGEAVFEVPTALYRVGVKAPLRHSADPHMEPTEEWKDTWAAWGAVGISRDVVYEFPLKWWFE